MYSLRTTCCAQKGVIGGVITTDDRLFEQREHRHFNFPIGDDAITNRLMKDREVIARDTHFLIQSNLPLINHVQNRQRDPCLGNALLREKLTFPLACDPFTAINTHDRNARATRKNAPLFGQKIFKSHRRADNRRANLNGRLNGSL